MDTLGQRIRALRRARDWTQEELAQRAHTANRYLSALEKDRVPSPGRDLLQRLATALGVPVSELLGEDDDLAGPFPAANWQGQLDARLLRRYGRLWATATRQDRAWIKGQLDLFVQAELHVRGLEAKAQAQAGSAAESDTDPPFADDEPDPVVQYIGA